VANGLRYWQVGGRGQCLGAGKTRSRKNAYKSRTRSAQSSALLGVFVVQDSLAEKDDTANTLNFYTQLNLWQLPKTGFIKTPYK